MSSIRYAMLTLLAREPLSGYDIKQQMNNRMGLFGKRGAIKCTLNWPKWREKVW